MRYIIGCSSGAFDSNGNNIIDSIYGKGAQIALGFTPTQYTGVVETWLLRFLKYSNQAKTIRESIIYADQVVRTCKISGEIITTEQATFTAEHHGRKIRDVLFFKLPVRTFTYSCPYGI